MKIVVADPQPGPAPTGSRPPFRPHRRCAGTAARHRRRGRGSARRRRLCRGKVHTGHGVGRARGCGWSTSPAPAPTTSTSTRCRRTCWSPTPSITRTRSPSTSWPPRSCCAAASSRRTRRCGAASGPRPAYDRPPCAAELAAGRHEWDSSGSATSARAPGSCSGRSARRGVAVTRRGDVDAAARGTGLGRRRSTTSDALLAESPTWSWSPPRSTTGHAGLIGAPELRACGSGGGAGQRRPRSRSSTSRRCYDALR